VKVDPTPYCELTSTYPPWALTAPYTEERPRPVPPLRPLVVKKGSKMRRWVSGSIPIPVSRTVSAT
jgi:hypothetical protein